MLLGTVVGKDRGGSNDGGPECLMNQAKLLCSHDYYALLDL